jgi:hypothetical protein
MSDENPRLYQMLCEAKRRDLNCGFMQRGQIVVIYNPVSLSPEVPTAYDQSLLSHAIDRALVEKRSANGIESYVPK